ncbi:MAG TPA: hypothetical protein QGF58_29205 [Myxococcota bacterium]|nr:hypothetical protein [Myxococcota bacterium]
MSKPTLFCCSLLLLSAACMGCIQPVEAPSDLDEVSAWLYARFGSEDTGVLEAGAGNLAAVFEGVDLTQGAAELGLSLDPLTEDDVADVEHPGRDFADLVSIGLPFGSSFEAEDHAGVLVLADQTPVEPDSPELYRRHFLSPTDPSCFPGRSCSSLTTWNEVVKESAIMRIPYAMGREFRWVELGTPGSEQWAVLSRAWIEEEAWGEEGNTALLAMFSLELTWPVEGGSSRFVALWTESYVHGVGPEIIAPAAITTIQNTYEAAEEYLASP